MELEGSCAIAAAEVVAVLEGKAGAGGWGGEPFPGQSSWPSDARITFSDVTDTTATLTWDIPEGMLETNHFRINLYDEEMSWIWEFGGYYIGDDLDNDPSTFTMDVTEYLEPGTTYYFTIGLWAQGADFGDEMPMPTPLTTTPYWQPGAVTVTGSTQDSVTIEWTPALDDTGFAEYEVFLDGVSQKVLSASTTTYTFTGLVQDTMYVITVEARDSGGHVAAFPAIIEVLIESSGPSLDFDGNSLIDIQDAFLLLSHQHDVTEDGQFDRADIELLLGHITPIVE